MFTIANSFWVFARKLLFSLFGFLLNYIIRLKSEEKSPKNEHNARVDHSEHEDQIASGSSTILEPGGSAKDDNREMFFEFRFQNREYCNPRIAETENSVNTSKYKFMSGKGFCRLMKEPESLSFTIQELLVASNENVPIKANQLGLISPETDSLEPQLEEVQGFPVGSNDNSSGNDQMISPPSSDEKFKIFNSESEDVILGKTEDSVGSPWSENVFSTEYEQDENQFLSFESEPESNSSSERFSISNSLSDSPVDGGLVHENPMAIDENKLDYIEIFTNSEEISIPNTSNFEDIDDEYIEFVPILRCSSHLTESFPTDLGRVEKQENSYSGDRETEDQEEPMKRQRDSDFADEDEIDVLLEHQDLIEQMKMEMKNCRAGGLPTILEESETPKMVEDLKPLKFDEKLEHSDHVEEIQKVHKSYAEKMRKLDILNYQTMHAIGFLQMKDPVQRASAAKSSVSAIKSLLLPSLWLCKLRRIHADPTLVKSISELHINLEIVYIGQMCLSWEILHWQYGKARELLEHDSEWRLPYNLAADEFQQFQVLMQRFVENEPFQGPRVQYYAKNRIELRSFLQVPIIKDDCLKSKKENSTGGENAGFSIAMLAQTIDESMRVFWEFVRADKDEPNTILKGHRADRNDLQRPSDSELLIDIKTALQKKERRLKEILRSGKCMVKKFQKHQEGRMSCELLVARVELKLVSRVLSMSRITRDRLEWCQKKLDRIIFFNRKVHVEPSFLLFPF